MHVGAWQLPGKSDFLDRTVWNSPSELSVSPLLAFGAMYLKPVYTQGSSFLPGFWPPFKAHLWERLRLGADSSLHELKLIFPWIRQKQVGTHP